jgi:putative mRNA 3-end processing factor
MLLTTNSNGIYCAQADVYIDPWRGVDKAIITHAHSDHARTGSKQYLAHTNSEQILKQRLGKNINVETKNYNETFTINGVQISLHPAGHIMGSAQVRLAYNNEVWVVSGDYKIMEDGINTPFEPIKCSHFITESTFGMPIYQFKSAAESYAEIQQFAFDNKAQGYNTVLIGYALGKAQRILHAIKDLDMPIVVHGAVWEANEALGHSNEGYIKYHADILKVKNQQVIIVTPPGAIEGTWLKKFEPYKMAVCSGWMQVRGHRRRENLDKGIAISDHADWPGLLKAIKATKAENIYITHGFKNVLARYLTETYNLNAVELDTIYTSNE